MSKQTRTSKKTPLEGWHPIVGLMFYKHKGGHRMNVGLTQDLDGKWLTVAIEGPGTATGMQGVLDNHAHKYLGKFSLQEGIAAAEKYAREWQPGKASSCECDEIPEPRRGRSRRKAAS
jgi:hypothetical protein